MNFNIDGVEVPVAIPEGAIVQHAIVTVAFQGITDGGDPYAGTVWGSSPTPWYQVLGMQQAAQLDMEQQVKNR